MIGSDTYQEEIECNNCKVEATCNIPKGITVINYKNTNICAWCGCAYNSRAEGEGLFELIKTAIKKITNKGRWEV